MTTPIALLIAAGIPEVDARQHRSTMTDLSPIERIHSAYTAFSAADEAWSKELHRLFGKNAGNVRYTEQGKTGATLAPLYAEVRRTNDVWYAALEAKRLGLCVFCEGMPHARMCPELRALMFDADAFDATDIIERWKAARIEEPEEAR